MGNIWLIATLLLILSWAFRRRNIDCWPNFIHVSRIKVTFAEVIPLATERLARNLTSTRWIDRCLLSRSLPDERVLLWRKLWHYSDVIMSAMASQITGVLIIYSIVCSGAYKKHQRSAPPAFVSVIHRLPVNSSHIYNSLPHVRRQVIICKNPCLVVIRCLRTNFREICIKIQTFESGIWISSFCIGLHIKYGQVCKHPSGYFNGTGTIAPLIISYLIKVFLSTVFFVPSSL